MLQRKLDGWCTRSAACPRRAEGWPEPTQQLCRWHRLKEQKRSRLTKKALRAETAAQGKCVRCRKPSETYRCAACRVLDRCSLPALSGAARVTQDKQSEIDAATRTHADGRTRYHGQQKRGQQPKWQLNMQDLVHAYKDFDRFCEGIVTLATPEAQRRHKSDRVAYELAVAAMGESVSRRLDDILDRLGYFKQGRGE
jgi:hypothetical protein